MKPMKKRSYEIDMTQGPVMKQIMMMAIPLMITGILQLLYNAADTAVLGQFASDGAVALAAVGCTLPVVSMLINTFIGISTGANVLAGQYFGKKDEQGMQNCVHTTMGFSILLGIGVAVLGFFASGPMLEMMNTNPKYLDQATLYMQIYCVGVPATIVYNFGAAILRAVGDTERPMRYLMLSGVVNVVLNLVLVIVFHLDVIGVAVATVASQVLSAVLVVCCLIRTDSSYKLTVSKIRLNGSMVKEIVKIGVPAGLQSFIMSISHVLLQSGYNELDAMHEGVVAGNAASSNIDSFVYLAMTSINQTALSFTSQNVGARNAARLKRVLACSLFAVTAFGLSLSVLAYIFGEPLLSIFIDKNVSNYDTVIKFGMVRLIYAGLPYFTCGIMDVCTSFLRGMGKSVSPLIITVLGVCVLRVAWIYTVFQQHKTLEVLFSCYPVSWVLTGTVQFVFAVVSFRKLKAKWAEEDALAAANS